MEGCRKARKKERRESGLEGYRKGFFKTEGMRNRRDAVIIRETGKVECRTGWMQERRGAGKGGMKERRYAGKEIFKRGGMQI